MGDSFTIQISSNLVNQLSGDGEKLKKKTRKPKTKIPREPQRQETKDQKRPSLDDLAAHKTIGPPGWPLPPPFFLPEAPVPAANAELDAIRSVLKESERVVEKLQKEEEDLLQQVTQKAKDLHDKEFKLPEQKPIPCLDEKSACLECYKEHGKEPLKCSSVVTSFADCVRRVRQQMSHSVK